MINFDMIGKSVGKLSIMGVGTGKEFQDIVDKTPVDTNILKVTTSKPGFSGSDHASFIKAGIPALFFYSSTGKDYHTPLDDPDKINAEMEAIVLNYAAKFIEKIANFPAKLTYQEVIEKSVNRSGYGMKVRLGITPSFENNGNKGLKIDGVSEKSVAENSGIQKGDIITSINGLTVGNINDYMVRMQKINPGEKAIFTILRNGQQMEIEVQF
jgi:C-terminal processing protease CtpA/Prc